MGSGKISQFKNYNKYNQIWPTDNLIKHTIQK